VDDFTDEINGEDDIDIEDEFNPDELDLKELESEVTAEEAESLTGKVPAFLARLQWWGFGALLTFIVLVILRMIFGPPWIDRFLAPRWPVAMNANNKWVGIIIPVVEESTYFIYKLMFVDYSGTIVYQENLGRVQSQMGSLDISLGREFCYYITGSGTWVGVRPYDQPTNSNYDIDLKQFDFKYRDGLNLIYVPRLSKELIEVYTDNNLIILEKDGISWKSILERDTMSWESGLEIVDICDSYALVSSGPALFTVTLDNFRMPQERYYIKPLQRRPLYPGEFVYKPAFLITIPGKYGSFLVVKNDRMFNLPYKLGDDQCFIKSAKSKDLRAFRHPYFNGRDIRSAVFVKPEKIDELYDINDIIDELNDIELVILYEYAKKFHLAALKLDESKPLWDLTLGQSSID